jgi:hypothetical protein
VKSNQTVREFKYYLNLGVVGGDEDFFLAITVQVGDDRRREALSLVFDRVLIG